VALGETVRADEWLEWLLDAYGESKRNASALFEALYDRFAAPTPPHSGRSARASPAAAAVPCPACSRLGLGGRALRLKGRSRGCSCERAVRRDTSLCRHLLGPCEGLPSVLGP
jgi:hypothetical protein